ncbi:hypothetical protein N7460_003623 [Penicillium canescens]|uniref:Protein kinase domain-containing protein n=1 Tax=Penicillium canescens TaxID=5083 RepID=A0AAD6IGD2_PENCN|nr:hypothetical protein N7444_012031 [Penicillium canescens]KAJ6047476.1 hypothetical protein N7460_003623 [Penicillium canescens]
MTELSEKGFIDMLGTPEIGNVRRRDGKALGPTLTEYIVRSLHTGRIFLYAAAPKKLHTPLPHRAPEVIFQDHVDYRVDLWSMGRMLFDLFTGQPPFDTFMITHPVLVRQMQEMASDILPARWHNSWDTMKEKDSETPETRRSPRTPGMACRNGWKKYTLTNVTPEYITRLGQAIGKLLYFAPCARASTTEVSHDPWFNE